MKESEAVSVEGRVDLHRKNRRRPTISRRMCAQSEQRSADGGGGPQRRGGVRMQRSFPPRFYRERRDILTLSVPSKKGAFMHDRARMRDGERMDRERTGWKRHRARGGVLLRGGLA